MLNGLQNYRPSVMKFGTIMNVVADTLSRVPWGSVANIIEMEEFSDWKY